jgi:recombination protein RecT
MASDRLRTAAARTAGREVATPGPGDNSGGGGDLRAQIRAMVPQFQLAMPHGADAEQLARDALTVLSNNPKLMECDPRSVIGGLMTIAQLGLRPGVGALGHAWLIPFKGKATLVIGYKGWLELVYRSGMVSTIGVRPIREADTFSYEYQDARTVIRHVPEWRTESPIIGWYGVATRTDGGEMITEPWSRERVERHRDRFAMAKDRNGTIVGPWRDDFESMAAKTVLLNLMRLLPKSTEIMRAQAADDTVRVQVNPLAQFDDPGVAVRPITAAPTTGPDVENLELTDALPDAFPGESFDTTTGEAIPVEDPPGWNTAGDR